jgi:hypothetical protein
MYDITNPRYYLDGAIDELAIYNRALDPSEIIAIYNAGSAGKCKELFTDVTTSPLNNSGNSQGVAWGDYDNDGDQDLYITNSGSANKLLRNNGGGVFVDATSGTPLGNMSSGVSSVWGDYDNDGDLDLYLANYQGWSENKLYRNDTGGVFTDVTADPLGNGLGGGQSVAWGDYDNDGDIDLHLANTTHTKLFRNENSGFFTDATTVPLEDTQWAAGTAWVDYDDDGDLDLSVVDDFQVKLFRNDENGVFASDSIGNTDECRSAAWGDYDNDGDLDVYVARSLDNKLFRNDGGGIFTDVTSGPLGDTGWAKGVGWADYDNDGDLDLYLCNSNVSNRLFSNNGGGSFSDVTDGSLAFATVQSWDFAWGDYDNDGDLDIYMGNGTSNRLLRNNLNNGSHWLHVNLVGTASNRCAIGARVRAVAGGIHQNREISAGSGYHSQHSLTAEFGLGTATSVDTVEVKWPSGLTDVLTGVSIDTVIAIVETPQYATINTVEDVPDDQGGWLRIHFRRSTYDKTSETTNPITTYAIHRRVDNPALIAELVEQGEPIVRDGDTFHTASSAIQKTVPAKDAGVLARLDDRHFRVVEGPDAAAPPGVWEVLGTVPARQEDNYIYLAPTVADSAETLTYSVYFIAAHTTTPSVYFDSPPDSGYSVDNIAPAVPPAFFAAYNTGSGNTLTWDPVPDNDLQYYKIYRGTTDDFTPAPANLVDMTTSTTWNDPEYDGWQVYYKVSAVDHAGNEGDATASDPASGAEDKPAIPDRFALHQNVPNPFNPTTVIRYDVPAGGGHVTLRIYDVAGRLVRTLVDGVQEAGVKSLVWNGANNSGSRVSTGVYFYRLTAPGFEQTRKMVLIQ